MKEWLKISLLLCVFGFLKEIRPSESFMTAFLAGQWRNITIEQVNREVYPVGTYSYAILLIIVFLITDALRYKPLIIVIGLSGTIVTVLLLWTTSLKALQFMEFFYGIYMATEVAYYTYIYAKVDKIHYSKVTSHTRAALLAGKLVASVLSQFLESFRILDHRQLHFITLGTQITATIWAFFLPNVKTSLYFHRKSLDTPKMNIEIDGADNENVVIVGYSSPQRRIKAAFRLLWSHFKNAYSNPKVLQWSLWYAVGMCGYLQVITYVQVLWGVINVENSPIWNGAVDGLLTFFGALAALLAGYMHAGGTTSRGSLAILAFLSALEGFALLFGTWTTSLYVSYAGYILFGVLYSFTITVSGAEIARHLEEDSFGLVFGINTLAAVILQVILTITVVEQGGFALDGIGQFIVYAFYFLSLGIIYLIAVIIDFIRDRFFREKFNQEDIR